MGLLAEIYIASDDQEALRYDVTPDVFRDRKQYKNFTVLELSTLWAIMQGTAWSVGVLNEFPTLLVVGGGERLVHRLPQGMKEALARMQQEEVLACSVKWGATAEMRRHPRDDQPIIEGLVQLCREAAANNKGVYLWNCV